MQLNVTRPEFVAKMSPFFETSHTLTKISSSQDKNSQSNFLTVPINYSSDILIQMFPGIDSSAACVDLHLLMECQHAVQIELQNRQMIMMMMMH